MSDKQQKFRFPWKMTVWSIILIAGFILPKVFIADIEEATGQGLDFAGIGGLACAMLLFLSWFLYIVFFSGWKWWRRVFLATVVASIPIGFLLLFEPIGGDLNGWRFKRARTALSTDIAAPSADSAAVDLSVETADDFAGFLGPNQNGIMDGIEIDAAKFAQSKILWKKPIGEGWSAFSARNGFAVTMEQRGDCLLYTSPSPRDQRGSRMPSSA